MRNKLFVAAVAATTIVPAVVAPIQTEAAQQTFKDVPDNYYAHTEITNLVDRGIIKGFSNGTFKPEQQVTRAEFATILARALDWPLAESNFKDVNKSSALYDGVSRAHNASIARGFADGTFKPNKLVTREDMAVMIDRAMQLKAPYTYTKELDFTDSHKIGAYSKTAIERLYFYNVMGAYTGTNFEGATPGTRAETARIIYNMLKVFDNSSFE